MATFYVARQSDGDWYWIGKRQRDFRHDPYTGGVYAEEAFCHDQWKRITGIKLKPGEGPVKVEIRRVK